MKDPKYKSVPVHPSEITPEHVFMSRRQFMKNTGVIAAAAALAACTPGQSTAPTETPLGATQFPGLQPGDEPTDYEAITHYNNYYEFSMDKEQVAKLAEGFPTSPWQVEVTGLVENPQTFAMEDLLKLFDQEERVYRHRCVEGWSMVIPWNGFPLRKLLEKVVPLSTAKYVGFRTDLDSQHMPGVNDPLFPWPYLEGLRLDEAMNDLALLATGIYGKQLLPQNGAPIRLVVPWKYGFKSAKSLIKIELVEKMPTTFWSAIAPEEYGFYANVNPDVPHPRWSQASERRIGGPSRIPTLLFNGYAEEVSHLYDGMNLKVYY